MGDQYKSLLKFYFLSDLNVKKLQWNVSADEGWQFEAENFTVIF